jgi:hypothetical protein
MTSEDDSTYGRVARENVKANVLMSNRHYSRRDLQFSMNFLWRNKWNLQSMLEQELVVHLSSDNLRHLVHQI